MRNKGIIIQLIVMAMLLICPLSVNALDDIDLQQKGSISVTLKDAKENKVLTNGNITLYQVAKAEIKDGNIDYLYTNGFENCQIQLNNLQDSELAHQLENKITSSMQSITKPIDKKGNVKYVNLTTGLYLVVQTQATTGYEKIKSFLVTIPLQIDGKWTYNVDASPKVNVISKTNSSKKPEKKPTEKRLPQTGQLSWPIPVMCISGLIFFSIGWILKRGDS